MIEEIKKVKQKLIRINKQICRLEDEDADFAKNERWIALDKKRTELYIQLQKLEEQYFATENM